LQVLTTLINCKLFEEILFATIKTLLKLISSLMQLPAMEVLIMNSSITENYYVHTKKHWMKMLLSMLNNKKVNQEVVSKYIEASKIPRIKLKVQQEFENLLPQLPDPSLPMRKNSTFTRDMIKITVSIAIYRILKEEGFDVQQIGQFIYEVTEAYYMSLHPIVKRYMHWYFTSSLSRKWIKYKIGRYNKRTIRNPAEYQVEYVEGDGKNLLFGINYTECAALPFLKQQDALEIAPYLCICDYPMLKAINVGFNRTENLVLGGNMCDVRIYRDYPAPSSDWPPENISEYEDFFAKNLKI